MLNQNAFQENTGIIEMKKHTAVFYALFGLYNIQRNKQKTNQYYISPNVSAGSPRWSVIRERMSRILYVFDLTQPDSSCVEASWFFLALIGQMKNNARFTEEQINFLKEVAYSMSNDMHASLEELFKLALAFDDGHGISLLKYEKVHRRSIQNRKLYFTGEGIYATRKAIIGLDIQNVMDHAQLICDALEQENGVERVSYEVGILIAFFLEDIFDIEMRKKVIEQIAKDLPEHAKMVYTAGSEMTDQEKCLGNPNLRPILNEPEVMMPSTEKEQETSAD